MLEYLNVPGLEINTPSYKNSCTCLKMCKKITVSVKLSPGSRPANAQFKLADRHRETVWACRQR